MGINRAPWDARVEAQTQSDDLYDVPGFVAGTSTLAAFEVEEVGPVEGSRLLHKQCHFGLDTLSWCRLGA